MFETIACSCRFERKEESDVQLLHFPSRVSTQLDSNTGSESGWVNAETSEDLTLAPFALALYLCRGETRKLALRQSLPNGVCSTSSTSLVSLLGSIQSGQTPPSSPSFLHLRKRIFCYLIAPLRTSTARESFRGQIVTTDNRTFFELRPNGDTPKIDSDSRKP